MNLRGGIRACKTKTSTARWFTTDPSFAPTPARQIFPYPPSDPKLHFRVSTTRSCKQLQKGSDRFSTGHLREPVRLPFGRLTPTEVWYLPGITTQSEKQSQKRSGSCSIASQYYGVLPTRSCFGRCIPPDTVGQTNLMDSIKWLPPRKPAWTGNPGVPSRSR